MQVCMAAPTLKRIYSILRKTFAAWMDHDAPRLGAALAFYSLLSLAPLAVLAVAIVAIIVGESTAQEHIIREVQGLMGRQGGEAVEEMLKQAQKPASGTFASAIGILTLLFGASGVFGELRAALNKMWDVNAAPNDGIGTTIRTRMFAFGMALGVGFLLIVSLFVSAGLAAVGKFSSSLLPIPEFALSLIDIVVSIGGISLLFALIFKYVPDCVIEWGDVWVGSLATGVLFTLGKYLIGLYIGKTAVGSPYGAAGSLVVVIVWVYYSSMIFLFGAELTQIAAVENANKQVGLPPQSCVREAL